MNIILMAFGSRGDLQPFLALAVALHARGHTVTLAAPNDYEAQINAYGIGYIRIPISNMDVFQNDTSKRAANRMSPATLLAFWREVIPEFKRALHTATQEVAEAAHNADLLIAHGFLIPTAYSIHQHLQIPLMLGIAAPVVSTQMFPSPAFPPIRFGQRFYNPLTFQVLLRGVFSFMIESLLIASVGGALGCLAALPVNGITTGALNFQTFSHLAFAFQVTPGLLGWGMLFAVIMGLVGGLPPAIRAARRPVAAALRGM
jgi:hypothetical protein